MTGPLGRYGQSAVFTGENAPRFLQGWPRVTGPLVRYGQSAVWPSRAGSLPSKDGFRAVGS